MSNDITMQKYIPYIIGAVILIGVSFSGGMWYERRTGTAAVERAGDQRREAFMRFAGGVGAPGGMRGGRAENVGVVAGEILSRTADSITVQLRDGGSRIVFLTEKTAMTKSAAATTDDLANGTSVFVSGTANADGSITAASVQIRPPQ